MNKLFLMTHPDVFQGENYLEKNKSYFEGWYFKNTNNKYTISFIPGININRKEKKAFIQVITNNKSYFIDYDIKDFKFSHNPFYIEIGNNLFSKNKIHIDIDDDKNKIKIKGDLNYSNIKNINTSLSSPNIMGPFSFISFMECNHAIISMRHNISGSIKINNKKIKFNKGIGYIEKDWGVSFPKSYVWMQGNCFKKDNVSFMLSIASIPFKVFKFTGVICSLLINDKEYRFTTYNNTKIKEYKINDNLVNITLQKGNYFLKVESVVDISNKLFAPIKGKMKKDIFESISSNIKVTLKNKDKVIFSDTSTNCGLEIVK